MPIMTEGELIRALGEVLNLQLSDIPKIRAAYQSLNIEALREEARRRIRVVLWEPGQKAPTGVLWEEAYPHLKEGYKAYAIYIDGRLVYFVPESPKTGQKMKTDEELQEAIAHHVESLVDDIVNAQIPNLVLELIGYGA